MADENIVNVTKVLLAQRTPRVHLLKRVLGERITKSMQNQHWQAQNVLIWHQITHLYDNEVHLLANGKTAFPDMNFRLAPPHFAVIAMRIART